MAGGSNETSDSPTNSAPSTPSPSQDNAQSNSTVSCTDTEGESLGGISGWTWQEATGIGMTWVHHAQRSTGLGSQLLAEFERSTATRGARRAFVTPFTFQAPGFYERHGYREIFHWDGVPIEGHADVQFRKDL